jgi:hypothetical protein
MAIELINRYISRATPKDTTHHVIVGVQNYKPKDFAAQMNVSLTNGWGIVRTIADLMLKQPEGKYVLVKDPNNVSCYVPVWEAKADVTDYYPNL